MDKLTPAQIWRQTLTQGLPCRSDSDWLELFTREYQEAQIAKPKTPGKQDRYNPRQYRIYRELLERYKGSIYWSALNLLTFGKIEMVEEILNNRPGAEAFHYRSLALCISSLLPLPEEYKGINDRNHKAIIAWVEEHKHQLHWSEEQGEFLLEE